MIFRTLIETRVSHKGEYEVPEELLEAYMLAKHGDWNIFTFRATPKWVLERVFFVWHLDKLSADYQKRQNGK
jgi:hypothetical protein